MKRTNRYKLLNIKINKLEAVRQSRGNVASIL